MDAVGQLAGGVAHDFNNLLTVISSAVGLLQEDLPPEHPSRGLVEEIGRAGDRAASLTRQLLAFSRKQVLTLAVLDLDAAVAGMLKMLRRLIGEDIELVTRLGPEPVGCIRADAAQLEHAVINLVVNARDAMREGGRLTLATARVSVEAEGQLAPDARPGDYLALRVTDTGSGMTEEIRARIFEPFFTTKEPGKGTGLGLATVYGIVKQCGGFITVASEAGKGSTFALHLPRVAQPASAALPLGRAEEPKGGSEVVLLVEDDPAVRALAVEVLLRRGYTVLQARNGAEALQLSEGHPGPIHLLATDVIMPQMNGRQLAERLVASRPGLKVLFLSGHTEDTTLRAGVLDESIPFLQKPFAPEVFTARVRELLDGRAPQQRRGR
jgi:CheY-like chemotaxis protein